MFASSSEYLKSTLSFRWGLAKKAVFDYVSSLPQEHFVTLTFGIKAFSLCILIHLFIPDNYLDDTPLSSVSLSLWLFMSTKTSPPQPRIAYYIFPLTFIVTETTN